MITVKLLHDYLNEYKQGIHSLEFLLDMVEKYCKSQNIGSWSIGAKVKVTRCVHGHNFEIGEIVEIIEHEPRDITSWLCTNGKDNWWLSEVEGNCL